MRVLILVAAAVLLAAGVVLGYIAVIAARRSEGVFLPAGYVSFACLFVGVVLLRVALKAG